MRPFFGSVSVSKDKFMGVAGEKDIFSYTNDTFDVSTDLKTGSVSVSKDTLMGIEHNLADMKSTYMYMAALILPQCSAPYPPIHGDAVSVDAAVGGGDVPAVELLALQPQRVAVHHRRRRGGRPVAHVAVDAGA